MTEQEERLPSWFAEKTAAESALERASSQLDGHQRRGWMIARKYVINGPANFGYAPALAFMLPGYCSIEGPVVFDRNQKAYGIRLMGVRQGDYVDVPIAPLKWVLSTGIPGEPQASGGAPVLLGYVDGTRVLVECNLGRRLTAVAFLPGSAPASSILKHGARFQDSDLKPAAGTHPILLGKPSLSGTIRCGHRYFDPGQCMVLAPVRSLTELDEFIAS
jgi:hypothetical protein